MSLNQLNQDLNDCFETYYPPLSGWRRLALRALGLMIRLGFAARVRGFGGRLLANERVVEYPQILQWIRADGRVLDIGCMESRLPVQLASLGYEVHGLDVRPYPYRHPRLTFHQQDLFSWAPEVAFDVVILVSVLEHMGLGDYGDIVMQDADRKAVNCIRSWLPAGGQLLVSVPFGVPEITPNHRIYSHDQLKALFDGFDWEHDRYFMRREDHWVPVEHSALANVRSSAMPPHGVAILDLRKP